MHKARVHLLFSNSRVRRLALLGVIAAAWTSFPCSAAEQGGIGATSKASVRITVEVAPRYAVRAEQVPMHAMSIKARADRGDNRICFDSNSAIPFTVSKLRTDGASPPAMLDVSFATEAAPRSACVALGDEAANAREAQSPTRPAEPAAAHSVTFLVSPL